MIGASAQDLSNSVCLDMPWVWKKIWQNDEDYRDAHASPAFVSSWEPPSPRSVFRFADEHFFQQKAPSPVDSDGKEEPVHHDECAAGCTASGSSSCGGDAVNHEGHEHVGSSYRSWTQWESPRNREHDESGEWKGWDRRSVPGMKHPVKDSGGTPLIFESPTWPKPKPMPKKRKGSHAGFPIGGTKSRNFPK